MPLNESFLQELKYKTDIEDIVSTYVSLRKRGNTCVGLCPFHNEKTPSFSVSPSKGLCKCFSCGKGGNVVHFIMEHEQLSYYEALKWLAKKYNIEIKERELTTEEKTDYTLVLKGHIALAMAVFPSGTRGAQLDVLARMPLWSHKMNFLHGTGHGVGHFLSVHEGPQSIRMNENPIVLQPGMVTSNEPGVYKGGSHGIRTENLTLVCSAGEGLFGEYLKFETITLCPICKKGIIKELLTADEVDWLNNYHQQVYEKLSPKLNEEEKAWLKEATAAI